MLRELTIFREQMPRETLKKITRCVIRGCKRAHRHANKLGTDLFREAVPPFRRLYVERELRDLAVGPEVTTTVTPTPSTSYVTFETPRLRMTAATRSHDVDWVFPEPYRQTLARDLNLDLFNEDGGNEEAKLFALLLYGGVREIPEPTQARVVFPLPNGEFFQNEIDLLREFPTLTRTHRVDLHLLEDESEEEG